MSGDIHVDFACSEKCRNPFESYGMICVGCGCCSEDKLTAAKALLALHERLLDEAENFDGWFHDDPELMEIQKKNVAANIEWSEEKIAEYRKIIEELEEEP